MYDLRFNILILTIVIVSCSINLRGQHPFDINPNTGGIDSQSQVWNVMCDDEIFYLVGDQIDTLDGNSEPAIYPWIGSFDYIGNPLNIKMIKDSIESYPIRITRNGILKSIEGNVYVFGAKRHVSGFFHPRLIEINPIDGKIVKSISIFNPMDSLSELNRRKFIINDTNIILLSSFWINDKYNSLVTILNFNFEIVNEFIIEPNEYNNVIYYMEFNPDYTLTFIGDARLITDNNNFPEVKPFLIQTNLYGDILIYRRLNKFDENAIIFPSSISNTVQKYDSIGWVMTCVNVVENTSCQNCFSLTPYTFLVDSGFNQIIWLSKFKSLTPTEQSQPIVASLIKCSDGSGFITTGFDGPSFIYKVNNDGDSLWLRKYIPNGWNEGRALWTQLVDLKETQYETLLLAGRVSDNDLGIIRPWVLHIDKNGCLIENCEVVGIQENSPYNNEHLFNIYPNPVTDNLFVSANIHINSELELSILTIDGIVIKSGLFSPVNQNILIVPIDLYPAGLYNLLISDKARGIFEVHPFTKI